MGRKLAVFTPTMPDVFNAEDSFRNFTMARACGYTIQHLKRSHVKNGLSTGSSSGAASGRRGPISVRHEGIDLRDDRCGPAGIYARGNLKGKWAALANTRAD